MRRILLVVVGAIVMLSACGPTPHVPHTLRVVKSGLGSGEVTSAPRSLTCTRDQNDCHSDYYGDTTVTLRATPDADSVFIGWEGDCSTMADARVVCLMTEPRTLRARFDLLTPIASMASDGAGVSHLVIARFLHDNRTVNTPARFIAALPEEYRRNWILMTRSESLQTGTATSPRILLPGTYATRVFALGLTRNHTLFPLTDPNVIEYMQWNDSTRTFNLYEINLRFGSVTSNTTVCVKCHDHRPNWDPYDSWAGMLPFSKDRIYVNSIEAAACQQK